MDPNATLEEIREQVRLSYAEEGFEEGFDALRLAELIGILDEWMSHGGYLPEAWDPWKNHGGRNG